MRCPNCGYISFDYLDQCVKCSTDLTEERQRLNVLEIRPDPVSFQEIMERMPFIAQKEKTLGGEEATIKAPGTGLPKKPEIDLSQGLSLDISIPSDLKAAPREPQSSASKEGDLDLKLEGFDIDGNYKKRGQ
ncbi:MAG: hypothetical protein HY787_20255 [Deltaproteobacteria bacterium]|nr:hypothetical protein [Deltaproteobacteria bacterium]